MALITLKPALLVAVVALLSYDAEAFTAPLRATAPQLKSATSLNGFFMSEDEKKEETPSPAPAPAPVPEPEKEQSLDKFQMTSARKEVVFDEKSGRFFETNRDAVDCIPEEEYCQIDDSTGEMIRLTVAEKERIFIDALQVCWLDQFNIFQFGFQLCIFALMQLHLTRPLFCIDSLITSMADNFFLMKSSMLSRKICLGVVPNWST